MSKNTIFGEEHFIDTQMIKLMEQRNNAIDNYVFEQMENTIKGAQKGRQAKYIELVSKLDTLSPLKTLTRGYVLTEKDGVLVKSSKQLKENDEIKLRFHDGEKIARCI